MSEQNHADCNGSCEGCTANCDQREQDLRLAPNAFSHVKKVIGIVSGKGGVGKSLVTASLANAMQARGLACGVLDADITGPSIPKSFGITGKAQSDARGLLPKESRTGVAVMSVNLLLEQEDQPVVWRGPVISGVIGQFWQEVAWGELDFLFVDMPPGTGDVPLTVFQRLPVDGILIVTTPQDLVGMIVRKAYHMAQMMHIPVLGLIENMSYFECPDCNEKHQIFGESRLDDFAKENGVPVLARLPLSPQTAALVDKGAIELADDKPFAPVLDLLLGLV